MALWPFRRKSARKRPRSGAALSDGEGPPAQPPPGGAVAKAAPKQKQRTEPNKLQRRPRAYSFSPGRHDSIRVGRPHGPGDPANREGPLAADVAGEQMPTLHHRNHQQPTRSSKRRREDHERKAEIKAMSASTSTRAAADVSAAGALTRRSSKRARTSKTAAFGGHWDKPASNVSLPLFDSVYSSHSSDSECVSFKVSALDCLAPRPTLRYAAGSRWAPSGAPVPARSGSQKKTLAEREATMAEEMLDSRKRIDDLADGLGASDLRELMERDNRRRERRRQRDQERMERWLARRADKQRRDEAEANKSGTPPPENLERGVLGRELVGLGIEPPSAIVTSSKKRASHPTPDAVSDTEAAQPKEPLQVFHRTDTMPRGGEPVEPDVPMAPPPHGFLLAGILRSKKSQSKSTLNSDRDKTVAEDDSARKGSEASSRGTRFSLASFLKWGGRKRRNSGPSSFNTSREEMQAAASAWAEAFVRLQGDDASLQGNYLASKPGAGAPRRTRSRFREDLPDYPLSPPDSRVQSPEAEVPLPMVAEVWTPDTELHATLPTPHDMAPSGTPPASATRPGPVSIDRAGAVSPEAQQSISLASIDSEGSWLSGRVGSPRKRAMRDKMVRANRRELASDSPTGSTHEDVVMSDDEYRPRLPADGNSGGMAAGRRFGD